MDFTSGIQSRMNCSKPSNLASTAAGIRRWRVSSADGSCCLDLAYEIAGENISIHARVFAVADVYDALVSDQ